LTTISAEVILASRHSETGKILWTIRCRYPRWIHAEGRTHRVLRIQEGVDSWVEIKTPSLMEDEDLSRNAGSSRAIPVKKLIDDVLADPAVPLFWGANQKGMQAGGECSELVDLSFNDLDLLCVTSTSKFDREFAWLQAMNAMINFARAFDEAGYHKQIVNRLLEPFSHITVVVSGTEWENFFNLRIHKDAEPHIQMLAKAIYTEQTNALVAGNVQTLHPGQWHMPFIATADSSVLVNCDSFPKVFKDTLKLSASRCASTSYKTVEGFDMTMERAIPLFDKLVSNVPIHASPLEHVAMADKHWDFHGNGEGGYEHKEDHRNFVGFRQLRALVERGEFK
jgi:hypothetical protein